MSTLRRTFKAHTPPRDRSADKYASADASLRMPDASLWMARFTTGSRSGGAKRANFEGWGINRRLQRAMAARSGRSLQSRPETARACCSDRCSSTHVVSLLPAVRHGVEDRRCCWLYLRSSEDRKRLTLWMAATQVLRQSLARTPARIHSTSRSQQLYDCLVTLIDASAS